MAPIPVRDALGRLVTALRARFGERLHEVVLFGSYARGDADEDSDVDVLVVIDVLTDRERSAVFELANLVDREGTWVGLSVVAHSTEQALELRSRQRRLYCDIDREGLRL